MTPHVEFIYSTLAPRSLQTAPDPKVIALFRSVLHPRRFKFSTGAKFDAKLTGIVGIYLASAQRVSVFLPVFAQVSIAVPVIARLSLNVSHRHWRCPGHKQLKMSDG